MKGIEGVLIQSPPDTYYIQQPSLRISCGARLEVCRPGDQQYLTGHVEYNTADYDGYYFIPDDQEVGCFALQPGFEAREISE